MLLSIKWLQMMVKTSMILAGRHMKFLCILCVAMPALAWTGPGYLATVGPAPLRFWSAPHIKPAPVVVIVTNAPPAAVSAPAETPDPYDFLAAFGSPTAVPIPMPMQQVTTNVEMNAASQPPQQPVAPQPVASQPGALQPSDVVSPQMLLQYFNKGTNGNGAAAGIIAPLDLSVPHNNTQPPPSSAGYSH
jgi:hypothetical protein